jgi:hypothetical protein
MGRFLWGALRKKPSDTFSLVTPPYPTPQPQTPQLNAGAGREVEVGVARQGYYQVGPSELFNKVRLRMLGSVNCRDQLPALGGAMKSI